MDFEEFVDRTGDSLLRLAYVLCGDPQRAEDLAQTAMASALKNWRKVKDAQYPDAYVKRVLVNAHIDGHRRRKFQEVALENYEPTTGRDHADQLATRDALRRALLTLPPRARTVLVLRYYEGLDDAAISELMNISASAVRSTASRALASLRIQYSEPLRGDYDEPTRNRLA